MPKIMFIVDHTPRGQAPDRPHYKAGQTYEVERSYAEKYKSRGLAVDEVVAAPAEVAPLFRTPTEEAPTAAETTGSAERPAEQSEPPQPSGGRARRR